MSAEVVDRESQWTANNTLPSPSAEEVVEVYDRQELAFKENEVEDSRPRSPASSLTSLPPLPDLIPIRKASLGVQQYQSAGIFSNFLADEAEKSVELQALTSSTVQSSHSDDPQHQHSNRTSDANNEIVPIVSQPTASPATIATSTKINQDNHENNSISNANFKKRAGKAISKGLESTPIVQHRKSDRRRVGRDIFFLFEEHPANRRRGRPTKRMPPKRGRPRARPQLPNRAIAPLPIPSPTIQIRALNPAEAVPSASENIELSTPTTPRVNPIFLWVKQDDTRIVEVRCEDYDKRNRIRLTKTANGWRAIPRTDPTTSRVAKLLPNPMVRVKQEPRPDLLQTSETNVATTTSATFIAAEEYANRMKKSKKKKKKKKKKKREHDKALEEDVLHGIDSVSDDIPKILSPAPADIVIYESTNHERNESETEEPVMTAHPVEIETNNNNEATVDLTKNLSQINDIELDMPQFMEEDSEPMMTLCPETGVFQPIIGLSTVDLVSNQHVLNEGFDVDTKHLKELLDNEDLLQHCDNGMSGAELIDSLVKRGCEDNHISEDEHHHVKGTICLTDDFDNEEDEILMQPEPVEDIISRLGESLATSPKCLSFNEAGEIEGLHGELFQTSNQSDPFSRNTLEELSITIKDLEAMPPKSVIQQSGTENVESTTTIVSPDSCVDELPKDLTCKKLAANAIASKSQQQTVQQHPQRTNSRSSDAIQSPQPSGLPAVPPSPDLMHSTNTKTKTIFLDQLLNQSSSSPKICSSITITPVSSLNTPTITAHQKEPLDLGKHRKSASPTVSCSEEAKRMTRIGEPAQKRIKTEPIICVDSGKNQSDDNLIDMLSSGKDPDPLTQLRLLISNPEWKVPDPILVPKDRLNAVLASPAREIPLLLTTRPELRLPEAFAYPAILQDPDILVISMAQLEAILQKQVEITRPKTPQQQQHLITIEPVVNRTRPEKQSTQQHEIDSRTKGAMNAMAPGLANDIDAATLAAFNQMLWLPYIGQMAPELFKAMAGLPNAASLAEMLPFLTQQQQHQQQKFQQQQQQQHQHQRQLYGSQFNPNPMAFQNPIELAMWQEALSQAQMQEALKLQRENQITKKPTTPTDTKPNIRQQTNMATLFAQKQQQQKSRTTLGINPFRPEHNRTQSQHRQPQHMRGTSGQFCPPTGKLGKQTQPPVQHSDQKPRVTCKSLTNLLQPDRLVNQSDPKMSSNLMAMASIDYQQQLQQQQKQLIQQQQQLHDSFGNTTMTSGGQQQHSTLKVKPGAHLLDPAAMQRRLLNCDEIPEVGSTTNGMDEMMNDPNALLWHPLFGSAQKTGYTSPWQWTTVTATGE